MKRQIAIVISIVLVSFLACILVAFRLTGVFKEPSTVEKITLEPVTLTLLRPSETLERINRSAQNKWTQEETSITADIHVLSYREGSTDRPFYDQDGLVFKTYVNASCSKGYFSFAKISFHLQENSSTAFLSTNPWSLETLNCSIVDMKYFGTNETDAYIKANVLNSTFNIRDQIFWVFLDENSENHELQIVVEAMYVAETMTKTITIPIELKTTLSDGN